MWTQDWLGARRQNWLGVWCWDWLLAIGGSSGAFGLFFSCCFFFMLWCTGCFLSLTWMLGVQTAFPACCDDTGMQAVFLACGECCGVFGSFGAGLLLMTCCRNSGGTKAAIHTMAVLSKLYLVRL